MPPVKSRKTVRHAGAPRRGAAATGQPRNGRSFRVPPRPQRGFGRRGTSPDGWRARIDALFGRGGVVGRLFAGVSVLLLVCALGYGLYAGGHVAAAASAAVVTAKTYAAAVGLRLEEVTVEGRERTQTGDVLAALGATQGQFIFDVDLAAARDRLEALDWVERATVSRRLPGTVHIRLVERAPFAVWQRGGRLSVVDMTGAPITDHEPEAFAHLPLVVGHGAQRSAAALVKALMERPGIAALVRASVRVSDRRWNLKLQNGIEVRLPARDLSAALADLARLDAENGLLSREILAVDLRIPGRISILTDSRAAAQRRAVFRARSVEGGRDA